MIGSAVTDHLVWADTAEVIVVDNLERGSVRNLDWARDNGNITVINGDIRDRRLMGAVMRGVDVVFHEADLPVAQCREDPRLALEVLADGTFNVIEAAVNAGVRRVVAASSASVYGQADTLPTPEHHHPWNDHTFHGAAKALSEGMLRSFRATHGLDYVVLRYFSVYGPRTAREGVCSEVLIEWMERIVAGLPPVINGDGLQTLDFVYVDDVAAANIQAACAEDPATRVLNVASGVETSLLTLAHTLLRAMGSPLGVEHSPARAAVGAERQRADVSRARDTIGFHARIPLQEGLRRLVEWWRAEVAEKEAETPSLVGASRWR